MHNVSNIRLFHVNTEGQATGERVVTKADGIVDIDELHKVLNDVDKIVMLCLHPINSNVMEHQYFMCTGKLKADKDTYVFSLYTRTVTEVVTRKLVMEFNDFGEEDKITVKYFTT